MKQDVSRRAFVAGGAMAAVSMLGLTSCSSTTKEPQAASSAAAETKATSEIGMQTLSTNGEFSFVEPVAGTVSFVSEKISEKDIASSEDYDLVVCGAGMAGVALTFAAAHNGLKVVLIEKTASFNTRGHDICSLNSKMIADAGITFDETEFLNTALQEAQFRCNADLWKTWIKYNGEAVDWYADALSGKITPYYNMQKDGKATSTYSGVTTWHTQIQFKEELEGFLQAEIDTAQADGATIEYSTSACQLVQDDSGAITGVIAKNSEGAYVQYNGKQGVALCTGGYENNFAMLKENMRPEDLAVVAWRLPNTENTGDGHMMGMAVGGLMDPYPHVMMRDPGGSVVAQASAKALTLPLMRVNIAGERFVNESIAPNFLTNAFQHQPGGHDFVVFAGSDLESALASTTYNTYSMSAAKLSPAELADTMKDIVIQADTIEELSQKTGINYENLKATLQRATELHETGEDVDWGGDAGMITSFKSGPYFAIEEGGANLVTTSGLRITPKSEVIDKEGLPIPGLYALGNCSGDMFSDSYPHDLTGISHSRCVVFAYLLAMRLAGKLK